MLYIGLVGCVLKKSAADERRGEFSSVVERFMLKLGWSMMTLEGSMVTVTVSILEPETSKDVGAGHS